MTSLQTSLKQLPANAGFYITLSSIQGLNYVNEGTDAAPDFVDSERHISSGQVLRDHGKTLLSSGRVFRKVQWMRPTGAVENGGTDGVAGGPSSPGEWLTCYIELPGQGTGSGSSSFAPVARLG